MTNKEIKRIFDRFSRMNIMIIGDVMIDSYMWGKVDRISPEAPIPVVSVINRENRLGGAANVALNIQSLGGVPLLCSITGNDAKKDVFMELLREKGMSGDGILIRDDRRTTLKTRIIGSNQHLLRVDEESNEIIGKDAENQFIDKIRSLISQGKPDAIIFEDYDKGVLTPGVIREIISTAGKMDIPVTADPKKRNFNRYRNVDLFKPNLKELAEGMKTELSKNNVEGITIAARKIQESLNIRYLLVTLSEMGIFLRHAGMSKLFPTEVLDVADVSGAGDTVISVATACLAAGADPETMAIISNLAGGLVCGKVGVVPVHRGQLHEETVKLFRRNPKQLSAKQ